MLRPTPRLIWSSACVACLGAVAGALFWPARDVPRLSPFHDSPLPGYAGAAAGRTDAGAASARGDAAAAAIPQRPSGEAAQAGEPSSDAEAEPVRDAVADGPWRAAQAGQDLAQAPWHAYWAAGPREAADGPVAQALPPRHSRAGWGGAPQAATAGEAGDGPRRERAAMPNGPAGRLWRGDAKAGESISPGKASRRMKDLLRRRLARQASAPSAKQTPRHARRQAGAQAKSSPGRAARTEAGLRRKDRRKIKARRGPKAKREAKAEQRPKAEHKAQTEPNAAALKAPQLHPVLLSKVLGMNAIRPPKAQLKAPDFSRLARDAPKAGPDGSPLRLSPAPAKAVETLRPPQANAGECRESGRHWHPGREPLYHKGQAWGLQHEGGWLWLRKSGKNWWAWTAPDQPTWLWHAGHWWWRSEGVWFMLHQGEVWGYREFGERRAEGLIHPGTGTQLEYSADGERVAMITPGDGAWLFDARSGAVVGRWSEAQMPAKPKPHAPKILSLPP
jgi:hypothetical protein